jgi:5-methylcytosine-specific restriction endonuclease McrA
MKKHVKIYLNHHGYGQQDFISCKICGTRAVDIHHIEPKGMGGSKQRDTIDNLIALCRKCHEKAHANVFSKEYLINKLNL